MHKKNCVLCQTTPNPGMVPDDNGNSGDKPIRSLKLTSRCFALNQPRLSLPNKVKSTIYRTHRLI